MSLTSDDIRRQALSLGFDLCGIAAAADFPELQLLREWLDRGYAGEMRYMQRTAERRADVRRVLPSARSVVVAAMVYNTDRPYSTEAGDHDHADICRYAWGDDYHDVMGRRLQALLEWMRSASSEPFDATWYVDTGPVQERVYAQYAGIGWIGKNTCLINPILGSWIFLSEIIVGLPLTPDDPGFDQCGSCTLCLDACPTGALPEPRVLDATRCISYQTIERKGEIPEREREGIGTHVYGCDICQEVCPWNLRPPVSNRAEWMPRPLFDRPALVELWKSSDETLGAALKGSAMARTKTAGIRRNVAVAIGNSANAANLAAFEDDGARSASAPSIGNPMVRAHVAWAKERLAAVRKSL